ncbi:hypothetical protein AB1Y20_013843 [Prymnesium parvum]|uniref:Complex 1 LYR protein domain-containing protein n=1 Tax=Prymnesium parvum TaxID=97485 RepID=A0AB34II03_PRYPA
MPFAFLAPLAPRLRPLASPPPPLLAFTRRHTLPAAPRLLRLYRHLLRAASSFANYNFREYARRRVREDFRSTRPPPPEEALAAAERQLRAVRRQALVSRLYPQEGHSMEVELAAGGRGTAD